MQAQNGRGQGALPEREKGQVRPFNGRGKPLERRNEEQRRGSPSPVTRNPSLTQQNARPLSRGVLPRNSTLNIKTLKDKDETEVAYQLNEKIAQLKFFLQSQERQHNSDEFIFDLTCTLAVACRAPSGENTNKILAALKGSAFWSFKIPCLLDRVQASTTLNDPDSRQKLIQCLITVFIKYLTHLPSSYVDLPYVQLKLALDQSSIDRKEQLQKELDTFKQAREEIMRGERQKHGRRYTIRADEKPPNDFRDIPICPTSQEITTQERPFLRKNISKGRYENAEHYLDVQFRLLREDFLEPLREGIHDIVQNVPRQHRKQLITNYCSVRIVSKEFTRSGVIHQVQINVTGLNTSRWAHSKRLLYGSLLCLSNDNFNTMLFATVSKREPEELKKGRIDIQFVEEQDVLGIESRDYVYQMVESPAYFEAYRYVLKGLKKLDETTLPLKKYLVECSAEVDPPEYLRRDDTEEPVCYDLSKALHVGEESTANATAVPVLQPGAWPSVKALPLLNSSQLEAIRTAITTEFSVIQGPPGTGKTYVGAKIVRCLLENRTAWDPLHNSPMLMACYTNHALDQFLEKVLEFLPSEQVIRVGGRSKSEKLEACNLKNFTFQYRLHKKRKEVKEKITQNDIEMKTCKNHLVKADEQFLEFKDLEELLHSTHTNQLYNATFPPNEPNECRTPDNAFIMWLCELMGSCNQSPKAKTEEQPDRRQASHDATLSGAPLAADEIDTNKPLKTATQDRFIAVDLITGGKLNEDFSEQQELEKSYDSIPPRSLSFQQRGSSLENQPSSNASRANLDVKIEVESVNLATMRLKNVRDSSKITEDPQTEKELRGQSLDKISKCEEETTVKEHQRRRQGDEGLLLATPEQTNALKSQVEDRSVSNGKNNDGWTTVSSKVVKLLSCQESESNHTKAESKEAQLLSDENRDEAVTVKSTKKKKKKRRKKNNENNANPKINIAGDIASLNEDLVNEEVVFTDEAIALGEIWTSELSGETVDELNEVEKETITIEKEADFIQYQRRLQGDEDLLLAISKQTDYSISQEQDQTAISKGNGHGLTTRTHKKKGKTFFWEKEEKRKGSQARKELNGESVDEIRTLDGETIEQQYQKRTQGDEDLLLAISEQAEDPRVSNEENENGWVTLSSKKVSPFFWQESESNHSKEESKEAQLLSDENRDEALTVKSTKKKKKRKKNKEHNENPQINITGDIASLNEDLVNEEMVFTDEAIGLAEIWSLEPRKDFSKKGLSGETVHELNDADKGTIARERDTDFIQRQRRIQSDEDPLLAVSKQTDYSISQEQDQPAINKENDDGLTTMTHRKKGKTFFWQEKEERRGSQTRKELSGESVDEIRTLDEETIEEQYQKRTQGDEDLLLAISEQAEDPIVSNEENENGWVTLSSKKVSPFFWQESERNHSKEKSKEAQLLSDENRDEALTVKSTKKKKKRKKNKEHNENPQINIAGDIASLNEDLVNEEMVFTDGAIDLAEIWSLEPRKDFSKKGLSGETVHELNDADKGTIARERETDFIQCQRRIQSDEDPLLAVSKQTDYSISQEQDQPAINKENDDGLMTMTHRKKGKTFFWQEKEERRGSQTRKELSDESVDEIRTLDEETIVQQYQRRTQGDEDLLLAISEQAEDQRVPNEENENGWVTLSSTKVSPFSCQESESNHSKEESKEAQLLSDENRDEALTVKSTMKKKKQRKKNKEHNENPQINITGDIASLNEDLVNEEMVLTDEVIGIGLDPRKDFSKKELSGETVDETTAIEREAGLTQCQRCIQADDDLLLSMSEQTDYIISQEQDQSAVTNGNDNGWTTVTHKKKGKGIDKKKGKGKAFFWEENEESKGAHASKKTGKKSIQNNEYIKKVTYVREALKGEEMMTADEVMGVDDIWSLSQSDRLRLYLFWVENYRERYRVEIQRGEQEYERLSEELQAVTFEEEEQVIRQAAVVGMTTSGAARYHSVLQRVAPRIVVIEEAAEVMEAHIITSLSHNTKHTILIGDHKQLRPKATVYALAQKYNLEVSLFERMVMNNIDCKQLSIQHRMRPEIATLTKRIYDHEIIDHESVCHFPDISGVCHNMFFIDHCQPESLIGGLQSYSNPHEAAFLVALCTYLQLQGYERRQITVLTMYTGQLLVLQECMPRENFEGVKVCAVDNFQGEENDIILLSLVRSNSEGRIGFLGESNRICVALSRARKGFYCIGNFSLLKNQSALWKEICDDLTTKGAIGDCLELVCKSHNNATRVRSASDFNRLGGCNIPCGFRLQCGHACDKQCHASSHKKVKCLKMCPTRCPNEHQCQSVCHHPINCPPCSIKMSKTVPKCGHKQPVRCHVDPAKFSCRLKCEKVLQCGHRCDRACGVSCTAHCQVNCTKTLSCGHKKDMPCYRDPMLHTKCNGKCEKLLDCGHPCSKRCKEQCQCNTEIEITLTCEHTKRVLCRTKNNPNQCKEKCSRKLECGHDCTGSCHEDCRTNKCKIDVVKVLRCGHQQSVPCYQDPETAFCYAPCPRRLDCGHKCSSVCGRQCHEVQCKEFCQIKCDRGHSCQKRCGTSCGDCMVEVTMIIPACGHSSKMPCCVDPASLKCKRPCEKERICGHPCPEICGKKCEARPCKVYVSRTLSCDHVVSLPCHKNPDKFICKEKVEVRLTCGHKTLLECHVSKTRLEKVLCTRKVEKELRCKHKLTLPCFKNPEDCPCRKHVNVKLPCGHMKAIVCSAVLGGLQNVSCMVKVPRTLPCNHEATLPCRVRSQEYYCQEEVEITLSCGHNKLTVCSSKRDELQGGICDRKVTRKLPCGHEKDTKCSDKPYMIFCAVPCERFLSCGHLCPNKCGDNCARSTCAVRVKKDLPCGYHKVGCLCADDVSQIICSNQCTQKLMCGHQCPGKCSKKCSLYKCQKIVVKNLNCVGNHSRKMPCSADTSSIACQERCTRNLDCGHPCPGLCSEPCEKTKCMQRVEKTYPCGHREQLQCFQSKTATCKAPCRRRESCKHMCKGVCGVPCSNYLCNVAVSKTLTCGHKITLPCSYSVDEVECSEPCGAKLQCGHQCSGSCNDCQRRGSHEMCQHPCGRPLVCSHRCQATCSTPCPPCIRKCSRRCPHGKCTRLCFESCYPTNNSKQQHACTKPCTWSCPHYQCNNLCGEECDRPRCDASCPKKLACRHPCIGLCGENCPTVCATCHAKKLSSMLGGGRAKLTEGLRYLQLFDCGHIVNVEEMDAWMLRELERDVQLIQCPRCSTAITFSYRYGNVIKMTLKNTENVKANIRQLGNETANFVSGLVRRLRHPSEGIRTTVKKLSRHPNSYALDNVHPIRFPFLFTLKNHLLIMHQIEKALSSLENVKKHQTSLNWQLEVQKHSDTIKDALDKITKYLKKRQLDLRTLDQLHEHTRKFSLFASILEAQSKAIRRQKTLSSIAQTRLKMADKGFRLFLQGNDDALHTGWLERIVDLLRKEVGLEPLQPEEPKEFENFPGFSKGVWKLCEHGQVYFTSWIVCDGEEVNAVSNGCEHCVETEDSD